MNSKFALLSELLKTSESRFASFTYTNKYGETSRYCIHLNVNYLKVVAADLKKLIALRKARLTAVEKTALEEMIESKKKTLDGTQDGYTKEGYYSPLVEGRPVKYHETTLYVYGFVFKKDVIVEGTYPVVNSRPKTIAKNNITRILDLKTGKFREFRIELDSFHTARLNGKVVELV